MQMLTPAIAVLLALAPLLSAADLAEVFGSWSSFSKVDLQELSGGKIATNTNASMSFDRGLSVQATYLAPGSVNAVAQALFAFDPTKQGGVDAIQHRLFRNENTADFDGLQLDSRIPPVAALLKVIQSGKGLQLSKDENARWPKTQPSESAQPFLASILRSRWKQFAEHGEFGVTGNIDTRSEIQSLLAEESKIAAHFAELLAPLTVKGDSGKPKFYYWELANVNKTAAVSLGALYGLASEERQQVLDVTFYASSGYLASVTLYELVPVVLNGSEQTLVWQGCLVASDELPGGFGIKRKIASRIMVGDVEKWIRLFRAAAAKQSQ